MHRLCVSGKNVFEVFSQFSVFQTWKIFSNVIKYPVRYVVKHPILVIKKLFLDFIFMIFFHIL